MTSRTSAPFCGCGGTASNDVYAVGYGGTIMHYNGSSWSTMNTGTGEAWSDFYAISGTDAFAVGQVQYGVKVGTIWHFDGSDWSVAR